MHAFDPFALLGLDKRFDLDLREAERAHRELSRALHPDKFAGGTPAERRAALDRAAQVNEAWRTLREPVKRAEALLRLAGVAVGETHEPKASGAFLMEIMELREALSEARAARDHERVASLARDVREKREAASRALSEALSAEAADPARALPRLGELRFYQRFLDEVSAIEDEAMES